MKSASSPVLAGAYERPQQLFRYSQRKWLERALEFGEFRLRPPLSQFAAAQFTNAQILPFGAVKPSPPSVANYLTLSLSQAWDETLFDAFAGADCCLVIDDPEQFGERIHRAAQKMLPSWAGIDAAISYGRPSPLGAAFSKTELHAGEKEWLFAWRPTQALLLRNPVVIQIGNMENMAQLRYKTT